MFAYAISQPSIWLEHCQALCLVWPYSARRQPLSLFLPGEGAALLSISVTCSFHKSKGFDLFLIFSLCNTHTHQLVLELFILLLFPYIHYLHIPSRAYHAVPSRTSGWWLITEECGLLVRAEIEELCTQKIEIALCSLSFVCVCVLCFKSFFFFTHMISLLSSPLLSLSHIYIHTHLYIHSYIHHIYMHTYLLTYLLHTYIHT